MRILSSLVFIFFAAGLVSAEDLFSLHGKAQEAWKKKDYATFLTLSEQMVAQAAQQSSVLFLYARALAANNRSDDALKNLERIARMGGSPPARDDEAFSKMKDRSEFQLILESFEKNRAPAGRSNVAFVVSGKDLIPEGIAYDPVEQSFYIGSTYRRKILQVHSDGAVRDFTAEKQDGLWGLVGMEVDPIRRHLWANTANAGANMYMVDPDPLTEGKTALFKYDLRTGKLMKKYEIGSKENPRFLNDVAIAPNGDVYISESNAGEIYKLSVLKDSMELLIHGGSMGFPNGLAVSEGGKSLYVSHIAGITVMDLDSGKQQQLNGPPDLQLGNHDGLVYFKNSLIGIQGLTGEVDRIVRLHLKNPTQVERIEILQVNHPLFSSPTTGDMKGDEFYYIANSQLRSFDEKGQIFPTEKLNDPVILKVDLLESEKEELHAVHEKERDAHLKTDVNLLLSNAPDEFITTLSYFCYLL